jgi:hypothetical protein
MDENKWHRRIMHLTFFSLGIVVSALAISKGLFNLMLYTIIGSIVILLSSFLYNYIRGIDYMDKNHPDYKGEDLFDEEETKP